MATKQHEMNAVVTDRKKTALGILKETANVFNKAAHQYQGQIRTYEPMEDGGEGFEPEESVVVSTVFDRLGYTLGMVKSFLDAAASQDSTNCLAKADIIIRQEGQEDIVLQEGVPATTLLEIEHLLKTMKPLWLSIPTLDNKTTWELDPNQRHTYRSPEQRRYRTVKEEDFRVVYEATEHHPAQIEKVTKDVRAGTWTQVDFSSAIPSREARDMIERFCLLEEAVKAARARANMQEVVQVKIFGRMSEFLLNGA